jgi:hypothetical protein
MTEPRVRLWDADRQDAYVKKRDEALDRRVDEREGTALAAQLDSLWPALPEAEREAMEFLVMAGARACLGHCRDPLLFSLVGRGLLMWPPGVRPVLTDDLVTSFLIPPAVRAALVERCVRRPADASRPQALELARQRFAAHFTPLMTSEITSDPFRPARTSDDGI